MRATTPETQGAFQFGLSQQDAAEFARVFFGFKRVGYVEKYVKILNPCHYVKNRCHLPFPEFLGRMWRRLIISRATGDMTFEDYCEVSGFDSTFDFFWEQLPKLAVMVRKDSKYLKWRYCQCPGQSYQTFANVCGGVMKGFAVFHIADKQGVRYGIIDDMVCLEDNRARLEELVCFALWKLGAQGADAVLYKGIPSPFLVTVLKRWGFVERKTNSFLIVKENLTHESKGYLSDICNWTLSIGDSTSWISGNDADHFGIERLDR